jgi:CBS domain-containing protein
MTLPTILDAVPLVPASVEKDATYAAAAKELMDSGQTAIAVVDGGGAVVGLFGAEQALKGSLPRYLDELRHTAFARDDLRLLAEAAVRAQDEPIERHMGKPVTIEQESSALHIGEVFLHCGLPAIAVVDESGRFVGMLDRAAFARAMIRRASGAGS